MSMFQDDSYDWRDTYFVLFESAHRPQLEEVKRLVEQLNPRYELSNLHADENGQFESLTIRSPADFTAIDVSFLDGEEVIEQRDTFLEELAGEERDEFEQEKWERFAQCDARFDVMHFEQVTNAEQEGPDAMVDPGALINVIDALTELTQGVGVDPQSGMLM